MPTASAARRHSAGFTENSSTLRTGPRNSRTSWQSETPRSTAKAAEQSRQAVQHQERRRKSSSAQVNTNVFREEKVDSDVNTSSSRDQGEAGAQIVNGRLPDATPSSSSQDQGDTERSGIAQPVTCEQIILADRFDAVNDDVFREEKVDSDVNTSRSRDQGEVGAQTVDGRRLDATPSSSSQDRGPMEAHSPQATIVDADSKSTRDPYDKGGINSPDGFLCPEPSGKGSGSQHQTDPQADCLPSPSLGTSTEGVISQTEIAASLNLLDLGGRSPSKRVTWDGRHSMSFYSQASSIDESGVERFNETCTDVLLQLQRIPGLEEELATARTANTTLQEKHQGALQRIQQLSAALSPLEFDGCESELQQNSPRQSQLRFLRKELSDVEALLCGSPVPAKAADDAKDRADHDAKLERCGAVESHAYSVPQGNGIGVESLSSKGDSHNPAICELIGICADLLARVRNAGELHMKIAQIQQTCEQVRRHASQMNVALVACNGGAHSSAPARNELNAMMQSGLQDIQALLSDVCCADGGLGASAGRTSEVHRSVQSVGRSPHASPVSPCPLTPRSISSNQDRTLAVSGSPARVGTPILSPQQQCAHRTTMLGASFPDKVGSPKPGPSRFSRRPLSNGISLGSSRFTTQPDTTLALNGDLRGTSVAHQYALWYSNVNFQSDLNDRLLHRASSCPPRFARLLPHLSEQVATIEHTVVIPDNADDTAPSISALSVDNANGEQSALRRLRSCSPPRRSKAIRVRHHFRPRWTLEREERFILQPPAVSHPVNSI